MTGRSGGRSWFTHPGIWFVLGFAIGGGLMLFMLYLPSQRLLMEREKALIDMARFNRQEQERLAQIRDLSTDQLVTWIGAIEQNNAEFHSIQQRLNEQEKNLQRPGWFYITLFLI